MREVEARGIDSGIDAQLGDLTRQHRGGVEVSKRRRRSGISQIVGRHVHGLHRGDGAVLGRSDALLQLAHFTGKVRLVSHGGRHAAQQRGDFRPGLGEAEDVVDEEQRVGAFFVAEVLGDGETGQCDAKAGSGGLGHLAVDQCGLGFLGLLDIDDARFLHFKPEIVAFTGTLANAGEHGESAVLQCDVVDEFHDDDGLARRQRHRTGRSCRPSGKAE